MFDLIADNPFGSLMLVVTTVAVWYAILSSWSAEKSANAAQAANKIAENANTLTEQALDLSKLSIETAKTAHLREARADALKMMEIALGSAISTALNHEKWQEALNVLLKESPRSARDLPEEIKDLRNRVWELLRKGRFRDSQIKRCERTGAGNINKYREEKYEITDALDELWGTLKPIFDKHWPELEEGEDH